MFYTRRKRNSRFFLTTEKRFSTYFHFIFLSGNVVVGLLLCMRNLYERTESWAVIYIRRIYPSRRGIRARINDFGVKRDGHVFFLCDTCWYIYIIIYTHIYALYFSLQPTPRPKNKKLVFDLGIETQFRWMWDDKKNLASFIEFIFYTS